MAETLKVDLCVIGAGSGGLTVAAGASRLGASTVLIERDKMGGDCLNYGCVPSKSLLAAAAAAQAVRDGGALGVNGPNPEVDFAAVHRHVHEVMAAIAPQDSEERFEGLGVKVIRDMARFTGPREVTAGPNRIVARRFVVATGSRPAVPELEGLDEVPYHTNETIFDNRRRPDHLVVVGGGPIGCEMAQAHRRLGARVTLVQRRRLLPRDDPDLAEILKTCLRAEGVEVFEGAQGVEVARNGDGVAVTVEQDGARRRIEGSDLLLAVGRRPVVEGLNLEAAGVRYGRKGIEVDSRLRTSNRRVFAVGDVVGGYQFTHLAAYQAGIVLRNALFRLPSAVDYRALPWVTYTDPELAHVGMTEEKARGAEGTIRVLRWPFAENDRARTERRTDGLVKVVTTRRGRVLGASILGPHAGELLQPWILAIQRRLKVGALARIIAPYPTLGEVNRRAAQSFYEPALFSERTRRIVRFLARIG